MDHTRPPDGRVRATATLSSAGRSAGQLDRERPVRGPEQRKVDSPPGPRPRRRRDDGRETVVPARGRRQEGDRRGSEREREPVESAGKLGTRFAPRADRSIDSADSSSGRARTTTGRVSERSDASARSRAVRRCSRGTPSPIHRATSGRKVIIVVGGERGRPGGERGRALQVGEWIRSLVVPTLRRSPSRSRRRRPGRRSRCGTR